MDREDSKTEGGNPGHITVSLCEAYRETIMTEIGTVRAEMGSLKNLFVGSITLSTSIIMIWMYLLRIGMGV